MDYINLLLTIVIGILLFKLVPIISNYVAHWKLYFKITSMGKLHWFLGHIHLFKNSHDLFMRMKKVTEKTKTKMIGMWTGIFIPVVIPVHPDTAKVIIKSTEPKPTQLGGGYSSLPPWLGEGLLTSHGKKWERNRKLITPAFHFEILRPYVKVYNTSADFLLKKFARASLGENTSIDIYEPVSLATFDTMLRCAFSFEGNVQEDGEKHPYVTAVQRITYLLTDRLLHLHQLWYPMYLLTANGREFKRCVDYVHQFDENVINKRQEALKQKDILSNKKRLDFLDILLTARDSDGNGLTKQEIRDEVDTFLFEGHDTTASAITWALYALGKYPEEQEKVYQEVKVILGERKVVEWEDLSKTTQLSMFVKESMRCYTPVPGISRVTRQEINVDGIKIPPNTNVLIPLHVLHNRSDIWEDPDKFDPTRFQESKIKARDPYFHVPFSAGPRNCIGQNFAMNEIKVIIMRVLTEFQLSVDENNLAESNEEVVMRAKENGVHLIFKKRN